MLAASHDLVGRMIAVKHFACSVHGNLDAESNSWTKQASLSARCLCMCAAVRCALVSVRTFPFTHTFPCAWILKRVSDVSAMHSSAEMNFKWRRTRQQQFPELFSWKRCTFSALKVIALLLLISLGCKTSGKHCVSTQFQSSIHGQWRCSKLYSSLSSQIRVSVLWFSKQKHKKKTDRDKCSVEDFPLRNLCVLNWSYFRGKVCNWQKKSRNTSKAWKQSIRDILELWW